MIDSFLLEEYDKTYKKLEKCLVCIQDIVIIAKEQNNYEIGQRVERLLNELDFIRIKKNKENNNSSN